MIDWNYTLDSNATRRRNDHFFHLASGHPGIINRPSLIVKIKLWSMSKYLCSKFGRFLIKLYLPVKDVQLKSMTGNISKISLFTYYLFHSENTQERKRMSYGDNGDFFYIFFHSEATRNTSQNISTLSSGSASIQNPPRHHILAMCWNLIS